MASNKKIFQIQINGITEATKSVDALYERILNLQKAINSIKKIDIPIKFGDGETNFSEEIARIRAELNSLKEEARDIDLGSDEYVEASDKVNQLAVDFDKLNQAIKPENIEKLNDNLKDAQDETEGLSDNVDDVRKKFESLRGIKLDETNIQRYGLSLNDLKWQISQLEKSIDGMSIGSEQWQATNRELLDLKQTLAQVQKQMEAAVRAEDQLNTKIKLNINGINLEFDDVNQAIGILEDKMYALSAAGKQNTDEFKQMAEAASNLRTQVRAVDTQIDAMVEGGVGINKALSFTQGFTSIATSAQGLAGLFGGGEDMTRTIATMTSLMGILQSIQSIKQQMAQGDAFGRMLMQWNILFQQLFSPLNSISKALDNLRENISNIKSNNIDELFDNLVKNKESLTDIQTLVYNIKQDASNLKLDIGVDDKNLTVLRKLRKEWSDLKYLQHQGTISQEDADRLAELENYISQIRQHQDVLELVSKETYTASDAFSLLTDQLKGMKTNLADNIKSFLNLGNTAKSTTVGFNMVSTAIKGATVAVKLFTTALKATVIFLVIDAIMRLVDVTTQWITKQVEAIKGNDKLVNSLDIVKSKLDSTSDSIERYNRGIDNMQNAGLLSELDAFAQKMEYLELQIRKSTNELQQFVEAMGKAKSLEESASEGNYTWFGIASSIEDIEDFEEAYNRLLRAVESGKDETLGEGFGSLWFTASDAKADLGEMQIKVINDIQDRINKLDLSKEKGELEEFFKTLDEEMYKTSLDNIDNLFPEQEWAQVLKERLAALREMYDEWDEMSTQRSIDELNNLKEINKQIRDNNTEAISDDYERQKQSLQNQRQDEIDSAEGNRELIISINKKYDRLELDLEKQHNEQLRSEREAEIEKQKSEQEALNSVLRQIRDNQLAIEEESLDKRIKSLENAKNDEIQSARDGGTMVGELILSIEQKYDKLIEDERKKHLDYLNNLAEEYARRQQELIQSLKEDELNEQSTDIDINYNTNVNTSEGSFDFNAEYGQRINAEKEFSKQRLDIELDYLKEKARIDKEYAKLDSENYVTDETNRYSDRLKELESFYKEGQLSLEEYDSFVEQENELHSTRIQQIQEQLNNNLKTIDENYENDSKETTSRMLTENVNLYSEYSRQVMDIMSNSTNNRNAFGIISYSETRNQLDEALNVVRKGVDAIEKEMQDLKNKLESNQITFVDYKDARKQLEDTKKELENQGKDITATLEGLFSQVAGNWKGLFDGFVSQIGSLLSTLNDTKMIMIENQLAEIEHQMEIQEEAYERAEEAAQAHKDKMDSIEDELSEARGSRRQFLIDTLAAQQAAYLEDVQAQQKAENEKEKLEKKQEALEKKRQEQEKKSKVQQAIINTYMAVSNALAVQPWFVGLALSAVALALGMKNVAAIKSTPIYEDGGVIQGKRHSQGGVKILGGQAEVEGGEFITNRKSTAKNLPLLTYINDKKREVTPQELIEFFYEGTPKIKTKSTRRFADGGILPTTAGNEINRIISVEDTTEDNTTYVVQVVDIVNATENLKKVQTLSGLVNE